MNKTKAFSKAAVIIAMIVPLLGTTCGQPEQHEQQSASEPTKTLSEDEGSTDANNTKTQPTSGTASTDLKSNSNPTVPNSATSTIETTGNGVTPSVQYLNDNNLGISNSIPIQPPLE